MKKLFAVLVLALFISGCFYAAKEVDKEYDKAEDSKSSKY